MFDLIISIVVLAAVALVAGSVVLLRRGEKKKAGLMAILAIIMIMNAAIWLIPDADGDNMIDAAARPGE